MKPLLLEKGSGELGFAVLLVVCDSLYFLFPGGERCRCHPLWLYASESMQQEAGQDRLVSPRSV
jgi:hypothetical protein